MSYHESEQLSGLMYSLEDGMGFYLDVVEIYAKKIKSNERFEIMNACKELKQLRKHLLQTVTGLIEHSAGAKTEQVSKGKQEKRLSLLKGKAEAFSQFIEIVEQQQRALEEQIKAAQGTTVKPKRR